MFKVAPFSTAVEAFELISDMAIFYYEKQMLDGVEFIVTFDEFKKILELLSESMNKGTSIPVFKKELKSNGFILPKDLPETLRRTIIGGAYAAGRLKQATQSEYHPYFGYVAINDGRTTSCCSHLSGIIRRIDDPFWKTHAPPNHINCRSITVSLSEKDALKRSENNQGLNKFITCKMKPDEGWDFNISEDLEAFVNVGVVGLVRKDAVYSVC